MRAEEEEQKKMNALRAQEQNKKQEKKKRVKNDAFSCIMFWFRGRIEKKNIYTRYIAWEDKKFFQPNQYTIQQWAKHAKCINRKWRGAHSETLQTRWCYNNNGDDNKWLSGNRHRIERVGLTIVKTFDLLNREIQFLTLFFLFFSLRMCI